MNPAPRIVVGLNAVIIAITDDQPRVLTVSLPEGTPLEGGGEIGSAEDRRTVEALPTGPLDPAGDRTFELALRRWVRTYAGVELGYVEQLYTFGDRFRDPRERDGGPRVISAAYFALMRETAPASGLAARWRNVYQFLPWEDGRSGRPKMIDAAIVPELQKWIRGAGQPEVEEIRRERTAIAFDLEGQQWDRDRVLDRYELLYELGMVPEAARDREDEIPGATGPLGGREMAFDHRRILATALGRIRAKVKYRPVIFEMVPETFTLLQLQRAVEALAGVRLHKQNFRRLVERGGLVEGTGQRSRHTGGRPAELFRFRREVLLERPAPGVGLPGHRR